MSDENTRVIVRWFEEVWNQGRREVIDEMLAPDCVIHDGPTAIQGPEEFKLFYDRMRAAFSDMRVTPHHGFSAGGYACLRWSVTMRHTGDNLGIPATGKAGETTGMCIVRLVDGRFAEAWQNWDMLGLMQQLTGGDTARVYMAAG
jgi:steroid delta-isomerase-like uncharacterized protein